MSVYNIEERVEIVTAYIKGMSSREIVDNFAAAHPNRPIPSKTTVLKLYENFRTKGCVNFAHVKRVRNSSVLTEEMKTNLCLAIDDEGSTTLNQLADQFNLSKSSCFRTLKMEKYKSYKIKNVHKLLPRDYLTRMEFCELWMQKINNDPNVLNKILFSDESTFMLNGTVNKQNRRIWARENPYKIQETHTQWPEKVNVWVGILGNYILGPFFIDGNLDQNKYLDLLQMEVGPSLDDLGTNGQIIFQQDGAPAHSAAVVTTFLNETFPNSWIGRFGPFKWPARSPDLTPLDFFCGLIYPIKCMTMSEIRPKI